MRHNKLILSLLFASLICISGLRAQTMVVKEQIGIQTSYPIGEIKKITFPDRNIIVCLKNDNVTTFKLKDIQSIRFIKPSNINNQTVPGVDNKLSLFPNPVSDILNIEFEAFEQRNVALDIFSIDGIRIFHQLIELQYGTNLLKFDVSDLLKGLYLCVVMNEGMISTSKFIKH